MKTILVINRPQIEAYWTLPFLFLKIQTDYNKVLEAETPYELFDWINADPQFEIEYYVISTEYYKIEAFKRELATIKDKHIIWLK